MNAIETKHTPGPWRYEANTKTIRSVPSNYWIATMDSWDGAVNHTANAALIAQAPDLLAERDRLRQVNAELVAALEWIVKSLTLAGDPELACQEYQLGIARAALAKAKGE